MITVEGASADDIWRQVAARMQRDGVVQQSRDQPTRELVHVAVTLTDPRQRVVFARDQPGVRPRRRAMGSGRRE